MKPQRLAAFSVRPRHLAAAIFEGLNLLCVKEVELRSDHDKADSSVTEFVGRIIDQFSIDSAAVYENPIAGSHAQRLTNLIVSILRNSGVPLRIVPGSVLLSSFAYPALTTLRDLRSLIVAIWPSLSQSQSKVLGLDAAAIGLYAQTQSLLDINLEHS